MAITDADIAWVRDVFAQVDAVTTRKMFGGLGIYSQGTIFALIGPQEQLMIKAKEDLATELESLGCTPFVYEGKTKTAHMPYWTLPDSALDDPQEAADWARRSLAQNTK